MSGRHLAGLWAFLAALSACGAAPKEPSDGASPPGREVPAATQVRTSLEATRENTFAAIWPDDRRLNANGFFDPESFPNPRAGVGFDVIRAASKNVLRGWGLSTPIYIPFTGAIDAASLPTPADSLKPDASLYLVALDGASPADMRRVPIEWKWHPTATLFLPANVLAVRPVVGFPLAPSTRHAIVVTTRVRDASGAPVGAEEAFLSALAQGASDDAIARAGVRALAELLDAERIPRDTIAGAAVFTTQPILDELLLLRDHLLSEPAPAMRDVVYVQQLRANLGAVFTGKYSAPSYVHGTAPYELAGGEFRFGADGKPIVALSETMRVTVCVPTSPQPENGYPVVFYSHGTGGDYQTVVEDRTCEALASVGIAAFGIDQVLSGPRAGGATTCLGQAVEECWANVMNPTAARNLLRQAALDHVSLRRMVEGLTIPATIDPAARTIRFDLRNFGFFGHSQGGLTGAIYAAIEPNLAGVLLSGAGGHFTTSALLRDDGQMSRLAEGPLGLNIAGVESLNQFHPALAFIQMMGEVADPLNYARYWIRAPRPTRKSVFLTSGLKDPQTVWQTAEALALAGALPPFRDGHTGSPAFALAGLAPIDGPVRANVAAADGQPAVTALFRQFPAAGHFPIFNDASARRQLKEFFRTLVADRLPTIPAP
ncbi:MAG: hypothetical protein HYY84_03670 [Deltaproteobacteria bacterium]|nr:hypothetical protein [Deltaproteobacteria bacterium]